MYNGSNISDDCSYEIVILYGYKKHSFIICLFEKNPHNALIIDKW